MLTIGLKTLNIFQKGKTFFHVRLQFFKAKKVQIYVGNIFLSNEKSIHSEAFLGKNGDFWISTSCFNRPKMIAFSFGFFSHIEKKILQQMTAVASVARLYRATLKYQARHWYMKDRLRDRARPVVILFLLPLCILQQWLCVPSKYIWLTTKD